MKLAVRTKVVIAIAALVGAYALFAPADTVPLAEPNGSRHTTGSSAVRGQHATFSRAGATQALSLFEHRVADAAAAGALFAVHSWYVPPPPPPPPPPSAASPVKPKPTAPPLPYQFMGSYTPAGEPAVVFLTRGDVVYDVRIGDTLDNTYSVDKLEAGQLYLTYKPLNIQQQLEAGGSQ